MKPIKTYNAVNREDPLKHFGISLMENIYGKRQGKADTPHRHDYYTVLLVKKAKGMHHVDFKSYPLSGNQVWFISPGQVHQVIEEERSLGYSMVFSTHFLVANAIPFHFIEDLKLFNDYGSCPPLEIDNEQLIQLSGYCEEINRYYRSDEKFKEKAIGALITLFLISCNNSCTLPFDNAQKLEAGNTILRDFKALVEQHHSSWHNTAPYAEQLHITPDHLNRTVKSLIGKTAKEYIQSRITTAAKRMLYFSGLSAKEIGYRLGFSEPANFSAFFKKYTGVSPTQFKKSR